MCLCTGNSIPLVQELSPIVLSLPGSHSWINFFLLVGSPVEGEICPCSWMRLPVYYMNQWLKEPHSWGTYGQIVPGTVFPYELFNSPRHLSFKESLFTYARNSLPGKWGVSKGSQPSDSLNMLSFMTSPWKCCLWESRILIASATLWAQYLSKRVIW